MRVNLWDSAGQERFRNFTPGFFGRANGVLVIVNPFGGEQFAIRPWLESIRENCPREKKVVLVANHFTASKSEEESEQVNQQIEQLASDFGHQYFKVTDEATLREVFESMLNQIHEQIAKGEVKVRDTIVLEHPQSKAVTEKTSCC